MPQSLATARGESRLALVREGRDVGEVADAARRPRNAGDERMRARSLGAAAPPSRAAEPSPFSTAPGARLTSPRIVGAVALISALGTVLLAALAASATLAWAGG